jgi:hypothetical protein
MEIWNHEVEHVPAQTRCRSSRTCSVAATDGFSPTHTIAIILAEVLNAVWMTWLLVIAWRLPDGKAEFDR